MSNVSHRRPAFDADRCKIFAWSWIFLGLFSAFGAWAIHDSLGIASDAPTIFAGSGIAGGISFLALSHVKLRIRRALTWAIAIGFASATPVLVLFGFMGFAYFILIPQPFEVRLLQWTAIFFAGGLWSWIDLNGTRRRVTKKHYIEREFAESTDHVTLRWERKTDLETPSISSNTMLGRLWNSHGAKIVMALAPLASAGYAISRIADAAGGAEAVLLLLTFLGLPISLWGISKLVSGIYLNIYLVWQVERKTGKPVLFDLIPEGSS
ncbi:hypothetical protein [Aromatoleum toluclasticum]|uniref:hypothetical protein n=1 Tax=Aromatoleum toluclasticum TaxID=92003 RepID=UPI0012FAB8A0|nr:hypothetical protein [Aromatoleum toluclasticum]